MTLSIYFLLCSTNQITAEQKNSSTTWKFYSWSDKKELFEENTDFWYQWTQEENLWVHSKNFWRSQLSSSSEFKSTAIYWSECFKMTWIWCHNLLHAEWLWWLTKSYYQKKLTKNWIYSLSQQASYRCWNSILIYRTENNLSSLNYQKNLLYNKWIFNRHCDLNWSFCDHSDYEADDTDQLFHKQAEFMFD